MSDSGLPAVMDMVAGLSPHTEHQHQTTVANNTKGFVSHQGDERNGET